MFFLKDTTFSLPICPPKLPVSTGNTPTQENKMHSSSDFILKASLKERKLRIPPPLSLSRPALLVFILSNDGIPHCPYTLRALKTLFFFFPTELPPKERHTGGEAVVQNCWYTRKAMVPGSFVWFSGSGMAASVKKTKQKKKTLRNSLLFSHLLWILSIRGKVMLLHMWKMCVWVKVKGTGLVWVVGKLCVCVSRRISEEPHSHKSNWQQVCKN